MFFNKKNKDKELLNQIENNFFNIIESIINTYKMVLYNDNNDKILLLLKKYLPSILDESKYNIIKDDYTYKIEFDSYITIYIYKNNKELFNFIISNDNISLYIKIIKDNIEFYHIYKLYINSNIIYTGVDYLSLQDKINILKILYSIINNMIEIVKEISRLEKLNRIEPDIIMIEDLSNILKEFSS